jgi:hypothetical protein
MEACGWPHTETVLSPGEDSLMLIEYKAAWSPCSGENKNSCHSWKCEFQLLKSIANYFVELGLFHLT